MLNLVHYQPWSLLHRWPRELEQVFSGNPSTSESPDFDRGDWAPPVDIQEANDHFVLRADMPGVQVKDIDVSAEDGTLTMRGKRATQDRLSGDGFEHIERAAGTFLRRFTLPETAQGEGIKARYADGVLEIVIPKQPRVEAKRVTIAVN
jgi:HSP20 family protein